MDENSQRNRQQLARLMTQNPNHDGSYFYKSKRDVSTSYEQFERIPQIRINTSQPPLVAEPSSSSLPYSGVESGNFHMVKGHPMGTDVWRKRSRKEHVSEYDWTPGKIAPKAAMSKYSKYQPFIKEKRHSLQVQKLEKELRKMNGNSNKPDSNSYDQTMVPQSYKQEITITMPDTSRVWYMPHLEQIQEQT